MNTENKMISIVTGTLNRRHMLERLVTNTVGSSDRVELVLVDGGSNDGTIEYIKQLNHPRIKLIEVGGRSSYPHYMNLGIRTASHDLICQWNDDVLLINSWDEIITELEEGIDFYLFNWKYGDLEDLESEDWLRGNGQAERWFLYNTKDDSGGDIVMNYGIYNKKIFEEIGMYDTKFNYYYADGDMSERAWHFGFKVKTLKDIKVISLNTPKMAVHFSDDKMKWDLNQNLYQNKTLPDTLEYLGEKNE